MPLRYGVSRAAALHCDAWVAADTSRAAGGSRGAQPLRPLPRAFVPLAGFDGFDFGDFVSLYDGASEPLGLYDDGEDVAAGSADLGQRGLRAVPQDGAGLGACVVALGDGDLVAVGDGEVVFFGGVVAFVVVVTGFGPVVGATLSAVRTALGPWVRPGFGATVVEVADGVSAGFTGTVDGVGLSVTSMLRVSWSSPPNVDGTTVSGSAWSPMSASRPVAAVASATMTTLGSSGPRCAFVRFTVATSPWGSRWMLSLHPSAVPSTDCTHVVTLCH